MSALTPGILRRIFEPVRDTSGGAHTWMPEAEYRQQQEARESAASDERSAPLIEGETEDDNATAGGEPVADAVAAAGP